MKLAVYNTKNEKKSEISMPTQFLQDVRTDLIARVVLAEQLNTKQKYGADDMAGKNASVRLSKRRHDYRGAYGRGASRIPRKIMSRRGTQINLEGAFAPGTVKGRRAHPPKPEKIVQVKLNRKEVQKAIQSALSATIQKSFLQKRNHLFPENFPFIISEDFEKIEKTKKFVDALNNLGLKPEIERSKKRKIRAGKGKMRGRTYKDKKGPLIVVSQNCPLLKSAKNIKGFDVVEAEKLTCEQLAPGTHPGRLTLYTENAIKTIEQQKLFVQKNIQQKPKISTVEKGKKSKQPKQKPQQKTVNKKEKAQILKKPQNQSKTENKK